MTVTFMIISIVVLFVLVIIRQIPWRDWAIKWVGNNPEHAQIYVHAGNTSRTVEGERIYIGTTKVDYPEGQLAEYHICSVYLYKIAAKYSQVIFVDDDCYEFDYIRGRRILGVTDGMLVPNPLGNQDATMTNKYREGLLDLSHLWESGVMVAALKSVKSTKVVSYMIYIVIGLIALAGLYYYMSGGQLPAILPGSQPAPATTPASQAPIEAPTANITIITGEPVTP